MTVGQNDTTDAFLEHFGVKGMHWGQRKAEVSGGGTVPARPKKLILNAGKNFVHSLLYNVNNR